MFFLKFISSSLILFGLMFDPSIGHATTSLIANCSALESFGGGTLTGGPSRQIEVVMGGQIPRLTLVETYNSLKSQTEDRRTEFQPVTAMYGFIPGQYVITLGDSTLWKAIDLKFHIDDGKVHFLLLGGEGTISICSVK